MLKSLESILDSKVRVIVTSRYGYSTLQEDMRVWAPFVHERHIHFPAQPAATDNTHSCYITDVMLAITHLYLSKNCSAADHKNGGKFNENAFITNIFERTVLF